MDTIEALYNKLRPFYWVPIKGVPFGAARGGFRWSGQTEIGCRHPTREEFARFFRGFSDYGQHYERDTLAASRYLAAKKAA